MKKFTFLSAFVLACTFILAGCGNSGKQLSVIVSLDNKPFASETADGKIAGVDITLAEELAKVMDLKYKMVKADNYSAVLEKIQGKNTVAMSGVVKTPELAEKFLLSDSYYESFLVAYVRTSTVGGPKFEDYCTGELNVLVVKDSYAEYFMKKNYPDAKVVTFADPDKLADEIANNAENQVMLVDQFTGLRIKADKGGITQIKNEEGKDHISEDYSYVIAVPKGEDDLLLKINEAIAALKQNGTIDTCIRTYTPANYR